MDYISINSILFFIVFETCIILSSIRLTYQISKSQSNIGNLEKSLVLISLVIIISAIIATVFTFLHINKNINYIFISLAIVSVTHITIRRFEWPKYKIYFSSLIQSFIKSGISWKNLIIFLLILPILIMTIKPIAETDSLESLNFMMNWIINKGDPYIFENSYIPFWELSYLPSLVITHSDNWLWLESLLPVIIMGIVGILICDELKVSRNISTVVVLSGILFFTIWETQPSGIGTLKNDTIYAAGLMLISFSIIKISKFEFNFYNGLLFTLGSIFITTKYSGFIALVFAVALTIILNIKKRSHKNLKIKTFSLFIPIFILTTGHYYIKNFIQFQNPFYPIKLSILGFGFTNGTIDTTGTSILSSINDYHLWEILFSPKNISESGILLPIILITAFIGTAVFLVFSATKIWRHKNVDQISIFLAIYILFNWAFYFGTSWSASQNHGDMFYIMHLHSMRYIEGGTMLVEIFIAYSLLKLKIPEKVVLIIFGANIASQILYLYSILPSFLNYSFLVYPTIIFFLILLIKKRLQSKNSIIMLIIIGTSIFIFSPYVVEDNRKGWLPWWHNTIADLYDIPSSSVFLVKEPGNHDYLDVTYPLLGKNFQHHITVGTQADVIGIISKHNNSDRPQFISELCNANIDCKDQLYQFGLKFVAYGYHVKTIDDHAILLKSDS